MKISLNWLGLYNLEVEEYRKSPQKLAELLTNAGLEIEDIQDRSKQFENVVIGQILEKNKHPGADNLTLCLVDTGDSKRRIVCGAKNHNTGDKVVVALPGAVLPGDFAIKVSKIRGEESHGMLCSASELGLSKESEGILILQPDAPVGSPFAKFSKNDDVIFDIKVPPNRSDCLSHFGLVREIAGLTGKPFEHPITPFAEGRDSTKKLIRVTVEDAEKCPRYAGRVVKDVKVGPSPEWMRTLLESIGLRSINNVVDVTNFTMMGTGQPLHAFDLAKLQDSQINVRLSKPGEKFKTLDEQDLTFDGTELLICDGKKPVALAGVMGGLDTGVTEQTKDVFIESAYFIPSAVRRASRRHGIESDSSYRFSRGVDPDSVNFGLNLACQLLDEVADGTICADSYDIYPRPIVRSRIDLDLKFVSARLGLSVESVEAKKLLEKMGCDISGSGPKILVNPPCYRGDLKISEDLIEEILRLKGFSQIPETLPAVTGEPTPDALSYVLENRLCQTLCSLGFAQAVNLNMTSSQFESGFIGSGANLSMGVDLKSESVKIDNPLNNDLDVMRRLLLPSLIRNVAYNLDHGQDAGGLFEMAPVFLGKPSSDIEKPRPFTENPHLAIVLWGEEPASWIKSASVPVFYRLKGKIESYLWQWGYKNFKFEFPNEACPFLHPGQSAQLIVEGKPAGFVGILHPGVASSLGVKISVAVAELNLGTLFSGQPRAVRVKSLPKFPTVARDVAFLADSKVPAGDIRSELLKAGGALVTRCEIFDLYLGDKLPLDKKSLAFRLTYQDALKTLSDEDVNAMHQKLIKSVSQKLNLSLR